MPEKLDLLLPSLDKQGARLVCQRGERLSLNDFDHAGRIFALIGPEGGLGDADLECARQNNFIPWQIGTRVLRTETAAIAAVTLLQNRRGDLN